MDTIYSCMYKILIHLPYNESENKLFYLYASFRVIWWRNELMRGEFREFINRSSYNTQNLEIMVDLFGEI